ncbi:MAG: TIGR00725 family protein [Thermodesulfovibrionales bacterium]|nr:TIGR00725 family protein [Thermodesulfovibrionales bacterium]
MSSRPFIAIIGAGRADDNIRKIAEECGFLIAKKGAILICGGLGGVMEAAAKGAKSAGGITVGILPADSKEGANPYIDIPVATGFGEGRNIIIVRSADGLIAIGGEYGTLSEIAFALKAGKPVIGIRTWDIKGVIKAETPEEAVEKMFNILGGK